MVFQENNKETIKQTSIKQKNISEKCVISNNCTNCASCAKHYVIHDSMLLESGSFHCTNCNLKVGEKQNRTKNKVVCEYWQPMEIKINKRNKSIKNLLCYVAKRLEDVASILKEDNEANE